MYQLSLWQMGSIIIIIIIIIIDSSSLSADSSIGDQLQAYVETDNSVYCDVSQLARIVDCAAHRFITLLQCLRFYFTSSLSKLKVGVKRELLDIVIARKLAYCGHTMRKQGNCWRKR